MSTLLVRDHYRKDVTLTDHQPPGRFQRPGNRTFWVVVLASFLLVVAGTIYFAVLSFHTTQPLSDLVVTAIFGFFALTLAWVIVDAWRTRHLDR
jgi:uncharacterized membrane protein YhaH (DUF805 family)